MRWILLVAVIVPSCEQVKRVDGRGAACVPAEVQAAFDRSCGPNCHTGGATQGSLSLAAGQSGEAIGKTTVNSSLPLIVLGDVNGSYLAQKIMANPTVAISGNRMPDGYQGTPEQDADINTILAWISGGEFECGDETSGTSTSETGTTGEPPTQACGLQDVKPGAPDPIDAGTEPTQIPPDIATILSASCGCHYADDLTNGPAYADYLDAQPFDMKTWAGFQAEKSAGLPYYEVTLTRIDLASALPMPPTSVCDAIPPSDYDTLVEWLTAGAPDGATWMAPPPTSHVCGIEDLKPGAPNPVDIGDVADKIPTDIGEILANNCGCHYADDLTAEGFDELDYIGDADLSTIIGFRDPLFGSPLHETGLTYVLSEFMPFQDICIQDDGNKLAEDDFRALTRWLDEGAPDGAEWQPD